MPYNVAHINALNGASIWSIPHRNGIVLFLAVAGLLCLAAAVASALRRRCPQKI